MTFSRTYNALFYDNDIELVHISKLLSNILRKKSPVDESGPQKRPTVRTLGSSRFLTNSIVDPVCAL